MNATLNKRERRAAQLLKHYETCERLFSYLNTPQGSDRAALHPDGKRISVALLKIERDARNAATAQCNGESYNGQPFREEEEWHDFKGAIRDAVSRAFGRSHMHPLPGFLVNGDPRGYALKIDNETPEGKALIEAVKLHTDWGGYGILSPEIDGN